MSAYPTHTRVVFVSVALALALAVGISASAAAAAKKKPDLRVTAVSAPPTAVAGSGLDLTVATKNVGRRRAPGSKTGFLLSKDGRRDKGDLALAGKRTVPKLKPHRTSSGAAQLQVPATTQAGPYHLLACADVAGRIKEANESNNCRAAARLVEVAGAAPAAGGAPQSSNPPSPPENNPPPPEEPPPTEPVLGAFRFTDLDLRDPHVYAKVSVFTVDITDSRDLAERRTARSLDQRQRRRRIPRPESRQSVRTARPGSGDDPGEIDPGARCTAPPQTKSSANRPHR